MKRHPFHAHPVTFAVIATLLPAAAAPVIAHAQAPAASAPRFANIFADHAVLQRGGPVHVWGTATPGHRLVLSIAGQRIPVTSGANGQWSAQLQPLAAGGPYTLTLTDGEDQAAINDVMVGDVFLCSGQSNMEFPVKFATNAWSALDGTANNDIRFVNIEHNSQALPVADLPKPATWNIAAPETTGDASAVCYYMARTLQKEQGVPVGMIDTDWGGTPIESWISAPSLRAEKAYSDRVDEVQLYGKSPQQAQAAQFAKEDLTWNEHDPDAAAHAQWATPDFDDSAWNTVVPTGSWKDSSAADLKTFDGIVWFRTTVDLTEDQARAANKLLLGPIDRYDSTWVNGVEVGSGSISWAWREYEVPPAVFRAGRNVIAVRVMNSEEGGGMSGNPKNRAIKLSDGKAVPLSGPWKYHVAARSDYFAIASAPWVVPSSLTTLYNGMIAPLSGYTVKLAAWYQGESNADHGGRAYQALLPLMMMDWRESFQTPDLPFLIVQLASYGAVATQPGKSNWAELREAQRISVDNDPHAAMVVTVDVGDRTNIHPTQKIVVGERLARAADSLVYGKPVSPGGPEATGVTRSGNDLVVAFKNTQGGLLTYSSNQAIGFEACTAVDVCTYASAVPKGDTVVLAGANQPGVISVRYAWADAPYVNLYSHDDLPAAPFQLEVAP